MPVRKSRATTNPRAATARTPGPKYKNAAKRARRTLDAYSIAATQEPARAKGHQHRLGEIEEDEPRRKRQRVGSDEEEDEEVSRPKRKAHGSGSDEGSDSEGNEWRTGHVSEDNDSDIDSDEAFGSSDEERFEGFSFGKKGAAQRSKKVNGAGRPKMSLAEDDNVEEDEESDFGEDGVDLEAMLDEEESDEEVQPTSRRPVKTRDESQAINDFDSDDGPSEAEDIGNGNFDSDVPGEGSDDDTSISSVSELDDDEDSTEKLQQLQEIASSLSKSQNKEPARAVDSKSQAERMLKALQGMSGLDSSLARSAQTLVQNATTSTTSKDRKVVQAPLPHRQQGQIDRSVAYDAAKNTLARWVDTVKHNRRADHLSFPLKDPEAQDAPGTTRLLPLNDEAPRNDMESTIQAILLESGLATKNGKSEDAKLQEMETLQANKMPIEEVMARRAELRRARELMFREEIRAKRIKKIKSKAYRRVHRKEQERAMQKERNLLAQEGYDLSDEEREQNDRRRAEERMGARHRESRWAKSVKSAGRAAWDEDARTGVSEMARRNEELRRRVEGYQGGSQEGSGSDSEDDGNDDPQALAQTLQDMRESLVAEPLTGLAGMKFMQRAQAAQKQLNDGTIEDIRQTLDGTPDEAESESDGEVFPGRKTYGPKATLQVAPKPATERGEFEERDASDEEATTTHEDDAPLQLNAEKTLEPKRPKADRPAAGKEKLPVHGKVKPFKQAYESAQEDALIDSTESAKASPATNGWMTVKLPEQQPSQLESEEAQEDPVLTMTNEELVRAAFGGDEVEADFDKEKRALIEDEDDKVIDNALPGWGSWVGTGISKRELNRNKGKFLTKEAGIKPADRKDARLERAIISERRVKKNAKYLASALPHPFESRQQYERALRLPIGPEWTTKETFQRATKPRVMVKQGIIRPMEKPLL